MDATAALRLSLEATGYSPVAEEERLTFDFGVHLTAAVSQQEQHPQADVVMLSVRAVHPKHFPEGIHDAAVGIGTDKEAAIQDAARIWVDGAFPVIHEVFNEGEENPQVRRLEMARKDMETGETTIWLILRGPVQASGIDPEMLSEKQQEEMESEITKALFNEITGVLTEKRLMWLRCSISRLPDGDIQGDCWLNNENWLEGLNQLYWLADSWPRSAELQRRRQFFLFKPIVRSAVETEALIEKALAQNKKKWWQFWR